MSRSSAKCPGCGNDFQVMESIMVKHTNNKVRDSATYYQCDLEMVTEPRSQP